MLYSRRGLTSTEWVEAEIISSLDILAMLKLILSGLPLAFFSARVQGWLVFTPAKTCLFLNVIVIVYLCILYSAARPNFPLPAQKKKIRRKFLWYYFNSGETTYRFDDKLTLVYKQQELTLESRNVYKHPRNPLSFWFFPFMDASVHWRYSARFFLQQPMLETKRLQ